MRLLDARFRRNKLPYILQCLLATASVAVLLIILDAISQTTLIAALGASVFIAFTIPEANLSQPRFMIGGYVVAVCCGCLCFWLMSLSSWQMVPIRSFPNAAFGALAVGLAMFIMVLTDTEHPPAAGLALGFVLNEWDVRTVVIVLVGIIMVCVIKRALRSILKNLI